MGIRIVGLAIATVLIALLVFAGLSYFRPSYSETQIGSAEPKKSVEPDKDYTIGIVGDISLADNWEVMPQYDNRGKGVNGDMLDSFEAIKMPYVGAGRNLKEAKKPYYLTLPDGYRVAFVNATRAEKWGIDTPGATATTGGVLLCYDTAEFIDAIKEAKANSDYVIAIIHWGTEGSHQLEQVQKTTAKDYLNAGADIIVGGHAHALQGVDYNGGKPIVYNLGDFIFNNGTEDTGILQIKFLAEGGVKYYFLPGQQTNVYTSLLSGDARTQKIDEILSWDGSNAKILADGEIVAK